MNNPDSLSCGSCYQRPFTYLHPCHYFFQVLTLKGKSTIASSSLKELARKAAICPDEDWFVNWYRRCAEKLLKYPLPCCNGLSLPLCICAGLLALAMSHAKKPPCTHKGRLQRFRFSYWVKRVWASQGVTAVKRLNNACCCYQRFTCTAHASVWGVVLNVAWTRENMQNSCREQRAGAPVARSVPQLSTLPNFIRLVPPCGLFFLQAATEGDALAKHNNFITLRSKQWWHVGSHWEKRRGRHSVSHDVLKCNFQQSESKQTLIWPCCPILQKSSQHCWSLEFFFLVYRLKNL